MIIIYSKGSVSDTKGVPEKEPDNCIYGIQVDPGSEPGIGVTT